MRTLLRIPQVIVAWMFNIVALGFIAVGVVLRVTAEWLYGTPKNSEEDVVLNQEGEMTAEDLVRLLQENYEADLDGGASQEDFEKFLEEEEKKNRKVH